MKLIYALIVTLGILMVGCEEKGPMEEAGETVDDAMSKAGETAEDAGDAINDAATDAGNAVEDACEEAKKQAGAEDTDC